MLGVRNHLYILRKRLLHWSLVWGLMEILKHLSCNCGRSISVDVLGYPLAL